MRHLLAGLSSGIAIHMAADLLSPMMGFALIHWPFPFSGALDAWPSRLWIAGNAFLGVWLACRIAGTGIMIVLPTVGAALYYSFFHEHGVLPAVVFGVLYLLAGGKWRRKA
ncbi:MAG: Uncharacterized protein FD149_2012 [Rhodospirillaceae bacterium]|nr:MAG: Uncharacterized protein FD149_2012 [Rhodospirillaceae bacterium]